MEEIKDNFKQKETCNISKGFRCGQCEKVFKQQYLLKRHSVVHTGERKYVCSVCGKKFKLRSTLNHHKETHLEKKLFACSLCPQQFSRASILRTHMAIHAKTKNFQCNICGKDFIQKGNLTSHMNIHSNKRPYKCNVCGCGFNQGSNLKSHILTTHSVGKTCVPNKSPLRKNTMKRQDIKLQKKGSKRKDHKENKSESLNNLGSIESSLTGTGQCSENDQQTTEPEINRPNANHPDRMTPVKTFENPSILLPTFDKELLQPSSLRLLQSDSSPGVLILVDDITGEITLPVIERDQVFQVMINTSGLDSLPDAQAGYDSTSMSAISNLCLDDILSERFD